MSVKVKDLEPEAVYYEVSYGLFPRPAVHIITWVYLGKDVKSGEIYCADWCNYFRHKHWQRDLIKMGFRSEINPHTGEEELPTLVSSSELLTGIRNALSSEEDMPAQNPGR